MRVAGKEKAATVESEADRHVEQHAHFHVAFERVEQGQIGGVPNEIGAKHFANPVVVIRLNDHSHL